MANLDSGEVVADLFYRVGYFMEEMARYDGAEKVYIQARYQYYLSSQNLDVAKLDYSIARVLLAQARFREAEECLQKSLSIYEREKGEDCLECSNVLTRLGSLYVQLNQLPKAEV
jgi:tetratricopeptide (TPR) repeat protein